MGTRFAHRYPFAAIQKVEKHGGHEEILRENPVGLAGMVLFKPHHRWVLMAGYGVEVEKH